MCIQQDSITDRLDNEGFPNEATPHDIRQHSSRGSLRGDRRDHHLLTNNVNTVY